MKTGTFFVVMVVIYALAFGAVHSFGAQLTNNYSFVPPGMVNLDENLPNPEEWMSDSGAQALQQLKAAMKHWATNATYGQHNLDGSHKDSFLTSAMIGSNAIERRHFGSNVTAQLISSNGYAQLPLTDVLLQWVWVPTASTTSRLWSVAWPVPFSNGVFMAKASATVGDSNFAWFTDPPPTWSSNEWVCANAVGWTSTNVWGTLNVSGTFSGSYSNRVCVLGVGRR